MRDQCECQFVLAECGLMNGASSDVLLVGLLHGAGGISHSLVHCNQFSLELLNAGLDSSTGSQRRFMMPLCGLAGALCGRQGDLSMLHLLAGCRNSLSHGGAGRCGLCGLGSLAGRSTGSTTGSTAGHGLLSSVAAGGAVWPVGAL